MYENLNADLTKFAKEWNDGESINDLGKELSKMSGTLAVYLLFPSEVERDDIQSIVFVLANLGKILRQ